MTKTSVKVEFIISTEEITPDEITSYINIAPDIHGIKGEVIGEGPKPLINSFWSLNTGYVETDDILTGMEYVYNELYIERRKIKELIEKYDCNTILRISIRIFDGEPPATILFDRYLALFGSF